MSHHGHKAKAGSCTAFMCTNTSCGGLHMCMLLLGHPNSNCGMLRPIMQVSGSVLFFVFHTSLPLARLSSKIMIV